ncbi:hypothetical protein ACFQ3N_09900 [Virgibacillus byunsanensis]|uniref:Uncharacterized protein n=2 Tax=Virgibacillus byunsanensis TaxID=570945 RepID=A0ABW3LJZ3_9BACI
MKKIRKRTVLACWILSVLMCSNLYASFENIQLSIAFIILWLGALLFHAKLPHLVYHVFSSFTISIGYIAILLWEQHTPVWMFLPRIILIPVISTMLIVILVKGFHNRIVVGILGISSGETIYSLLLSSYAIQETIGEMAFFDMTIITLLIIVSLEIIKITKQKLLLFSKQLLRWQNE